MMTMTMNSKKNENKIQMYKIKITGVVQGVGFRPFIYRKAKELNLKGYVKNTGDGVMVVVSNKEKFLNIFNEIPPLARIDSYETNEFKTNKKFNEFKILKSGTAEGTAFVPPDGFLCKDCIGELKDKKNPRHNYFFITCTNCGPRYTIIEKTPYDRNTTTMADFEMCDSCKKEYSDPLNRRYHAETIACSDCGPKLTLYHDNKPVDGGIMETAKLISAGEIVAIKGIGGFHLACAARDDVAANLRKIEKLRENKPFAIMVKDFDMLEKIAVFNEYDKKLLEGKERPIVILKKLNKNSFTAVSKLDTIGVMLPYTGLHYLLFDYLDEPIIMTSSNRPGSPITTELEDQFTPYVLDNDRRIENPLDDSVIKVIAGKKLFIRRSRGFVPEAIKISNTDRINKQILALGAEMMNTFCCYGNGNAILSGHIGNTRNMNSFEYSKRMINKFLKFTKIKPEILVSDLHPEYNTSRYARELSKKLNIPLIKVQHHIAHIYSVAVENNLDDFTGIACDGLGFGSDGKIWGGEVFHNDNRVGSLEEQTMMGGDSAVKNPAKMLIGILNKFLNEQEIEKIMLKYYSKNEIKLLQNQYKEKFNCIKTTSAGRILDAAAALLGICEKRTYDGEPAMMLESGSGEPYDLKPVIEEKSRWILKTTPVFEFLIENFDKDKGILAATVQEYIAKGLFEIAGKYNKPIVFSGGCAYNKIMTEYLVKRGVYVNEKVPAGDGGISFGQVGYVLRGDNK